EPWGSPRECGSHDNQCRPNLVAARPRGSSFLSRCGNSRPGMALRRPFWDRLVAAGGYVRLPSGLNAADRTIEVCPSRGAPMGSLLSAFHNRIVLSALAETMRCPSGLNAADRTVFWWPVK